MTAACDKCLALESMHHIALHLQEHIMGLALQAVIIIYLVEQVKEKLLPKPGQYVLLHAPLLCAKLTTTGSITT